MRCIRAAWLPAMTIGLLFAAAGARDALADDEAPPLYTEADLRFLQDMIVHHEQAVVMSALVPERTSRPEFVQYADYVARAQQAEIAAMSALLELAAERDIELPAQMAHGDPPMHGMLSTAQLRALEQADGAQFERLWLEGMIYHHEGAIDMARAQQLAQLDAGRRPYMIDVLVEDIIVDQRAEIATMRRWLREWAQVIRAQ